MATIKFVSSNERRFVRTQERAKTNPQLTAALEHFRPGERNAATFTRHGESDGWVSPGQAPHESHKARDVSPTGI